MRDVTDSLAPSSKEVDGKDERGRSLGKVVVDALLDDLYSFQDFADGRGAICAKDLEVVFGHDEARVDQHANLYCQQCGRV